MIHFKGIGEHSVFDLEKIILEQQEQLHQMQIEIEKHKKWFSFKDNRPPYYTTCLVKVHEKTEPISAWLANNGDSDIWTMCSTDIILPPIKLWRPIS
jgi:hypothetical protein